MAKARCRPSSTRAIKTAVKVSIAEYKTPSGRSIDKVGITPDIPVQQTGSLFHPDTDNVLQKAIEVLEGE